MFQNPSAEGGLSNKEQVVATTCQANWRPWLRGINHEAHKVIYYQPNCGSWSCPYCAENNRKRWTWLIASSTGVHLSNGSQVSFTTLTSHEKLSPSASLIVFPKAWDRLRQRARRQRPGHYVMIPEQHANGRLHVHMLDTFGLPSRWWKDNARACGLGYMAESEFARTAGGAARYASKYLSKGLGTDWPKGFRRVRTSPGFIVEELRQRDGDDETLMEPQLLLQWSRLGRDSRVSDESEHWKSLGYEVIVCDAENVQTAILEHGMIHRPD